MSMKLYTGVVESRLDPLRLGRCQVRIVGLHTESKVILPTEDLPWAYPMMPVTSAGVSGVGQTPLGPVEGTWVLVTFMDPDEQMPMMLGTLLGAYQTPEQLENNEFVLDTPDTTGEISLDGRVLGTSGTNQTQAVGTGSDNSFNVPQKNVVNDPNSIVGPLANLIAKAESGADGYNAFNRGTANGKIIPAGGKLDLTKMSIKEIMAKQALPPGDPNRLFAVGKYQCIPVTLKSACQSLNLDVNEPFNQLNQDIICQEYLVAKKRPALVAYYRNPDKNNEKLLMDAGKSLAAEFASIEDPYFLGYPYNGPNGTYYKSGNKVGTKWEKIKTTLISEWEFRNNPKAPPPTSQIAGLDKVDKGTDYTGVAKLAPEDDSTETKPVDSSGESPAADSTGLDGLGVGDLAGGLDVGALAGAADINSIAGLEGLGDVFSGFDSSLLTSIAAAQTQLADLVKSVDLNGSLDFLNDLSSGAGELLGQFGGSLNEVCSNLGIENVTGTVTELAANLGIHNASPEAVVAELTKKAGSTQGQATALLAKLENSGEPTVQKVSAIGAKNPDGSTSNGTGVDPTLGFQDPNGKYPAYKNEPDTNRLATGGNLGRTIVLKKESTLKTGVKIANGGTWDQSPVPYNAKYPFNKVVQTESGHVFEHDDTPGAERIHQYHTSGTFTEVDHNGTQVNRIVGDGFEIVERNGYIYVKGAYCVTVDGAMNLRTDNVFNLEVSGAANINIYNDANINVSGDANLAVGATLNAKAAKMNFETTGQMNFRAGTGLNIEAGKDINVKTAASVITQTDGNIYNKTAGSIFSQADIDINHKATGIIHVQSDAATHIKSGEAMNLESGAEMNMKSASEFNVQGGGDLSLKGANVYADGGEIDWNGGQSSSAGSADEAGAAIEAKSAAFSDLELPVETRGTSGVDRLPPLAVNSRGSEVGFDSPNAGDASSYQQYRIANNQSCTTDMSSTSFEKQKETPAASSAANCSLPVGYQQIATMSPETFTAGMKLSKHFTLGDLTAGGTRIPRVTYDLDGEKLSPNQIVANLCNLANNVLDPIYEKFGKFTITSSFRRPPFGGVPGDLGAGKKEGGDHPRGCAADIVFTASKQETYRICSEIVKVIPAWNQVIMEYDGAKFWIHVSCRPTNNKGDMFTMVGHKTYQGTFPKGGFVLV